MKNHKHLIEKLLLWYNKEKRPLAWRETQDPYAILVSEFMLQQTQVTRVEKYFQHWLNDYPTPQHLLNDKYQNILKHWEGLGYYRRCDYLVQCVKILHQKYQGKYPQEFEKWRELPGIGDYTASAICSFAFNKPIPTIEANTMRVVSRIFNWQHSIGNKISQIFFKEKITGFYSKNNASTINSAFMELGEVICKKKTPLSHLSNK